MLGTDRETLGQWQRVHLRRTAVYRTFLRRVNVPGRDTTRSTRNRVQLLERAVDRDVLQRDDVRPRGSRHNHGGSSVCVCAWVVRCDMQP